MGMMPIAYALLMDVWGLPPYYDRFDYASLHSVVIERKFPSWYKYPAQRSGYDKPHTITCNMSWPHLCSYVPEVLERQKELKALTKNTFPAFPCGHGGPCSPPPHLK